MTASPRNFSLFQRKKDQAHRFTPHAVQEDSKITFLLSNMWARYTLALLLVAGLATSAFFIMNHLLGINEKSGAIVNISGRQRMLSQRGALFALRLATEKNSDKFTKARLRDELVRIAELMQKAHEGLINGNAEMDLPGHLSKTMRAMYFEEPSLLDEQVRTYIKALKKLVGDSYHPEIPLDDPYLQYILSEAPNRLLKSLNAAVSQYETEAADEIQKAMRWEEYVYLATLLTLFLEGWLIFIPIINQVKTATAALLEEKQFSDNVINTSQALIIAINQVGEIVLFNQYSHELSGWSEEEVLGKNFLNLLIPETAQNQLRKIYCDMFEGHSDSQLETPFLTRDGQLLTIEWSNTLIKDPISLKPSLVVATGIDVTQCKTALTALSSALDDSAQLSGRLQAEVAHAALLQKAMIPASAFRLPGLKGQATLTTSTEVGGDYYDYYEVNGRHAVFIIGDVSGHGVAAGILVSAAKMSVHQLQNEGETDPAALLEHINNDLLAVKHESMFMTMICFSLDARTGLLRIANAGHVFPYLWTAASENWSSIETQGIPLGKVAHPVYKSIHLELHPSDRLFVFTDGLVEEKSPMGKPFGFETLEKLLYQALDAPMELIQEMFFETLRDHCQKATFSDDITLMMVEHTRRIAHIHPSHMLDKEGLRLITGNDFLDHPDMLGEQISRQHIVVAYDDDELVDLLPHLCVEGVRRVLPAQQDFIRGLGWQKLLQQHCITEGDDVFQWLPSPDLHHQFVFSHSSEKPLVLQNILKLLQGEPQVSDEMQGIVILLAAELLENSLFSAPKDAHNQALYPIDVERAISPDEGIRIDLVKDRDRLGLMVTDHWGTFTPATFLKHLLLNSTQVGLDAGFCGTGMYLMWRICDYMQIRVFPNQKTQVTLLWSLDHDFKQQSFSGFQFLYHNEVNEVMSEADVLTYSEML